jgi:hypothetical protein
MTDARRAKAFLDLKLGDEQLVAGDARQGSPKEVVGAALQRLAELRKKLRQEAQGRPDTERTGP